LSWENIARKTIEIYDKAFEGRSRRRKLSRKANRSYKTDKEKKKVALRKFPYPYKAAMTICSDIDKTATKEEFLEIQKFLNTKEITTMGKGIGLEIGNSFMMYAPPTSTFSYFSGKPDDAQTIIRFIKAGRIDVMHSYGEKLGFSRKDAVKALEELKRNHCKVDVWVDHDRVVSNFGKDVTFGLGDVVDSEAYHADLTIAYGIKFVSLGRVTSIVAQSVPITLRIFVDIFDSDHFIHSLVNMSKEFAKKVLGVFGNKKYAIHKRNELVKITTLNDGQKVYEFIRCDNHWRGVDKAATCRGLGYVISKKQLSKLKRNQGYTIVYTHLGRNSDCSQVIARETQNALRNLANEYEAGNIYVTTTSKLLNYYLNHKYLDWSFETRGDEIIITISSVKDPVFGTFVPTIQDLRGITFCVPDKDKTQIYVGDKEITNIQRNPSDYTGRESVKILY